MGAPMQESNKGGRTVVVNQDSGKSSSSLEATYTSLIQQHLSVLCVENATFLAERLVAFSQSSHSMYLLAMCYYRAGQVGRAKCVLQDHCAKNRENDKPTPAMQYLLAKCCFELKDYGAAEQVLLDTCRTLKQTTIEGATTNDADTDEWILSTTPCPVPNGAAGLYLLGNICRKSHRKQRAIKYYHMSLQLDPTMWTSYQALCEMGDADLDPTAVFGVVPAALEVMQQEEEEEEETEEPLSTPLSQQTPVQETALQPMDIGTPSTGGSSFLHKTSLFQTGRKQSSLAKNKSSSRPPMQPTSLSLFETPNLTPIPKTDDDDEEDDNKSRLLVAKHNRPPPSVQVNRAKHVAARLYYEPSPETTPPPRHEERSFWSGIDRNGNTKGRLQFSNSETPVTAKGREASLRKPRKLFPPHSSNKKKNNATTPVESSSSQEDQPSKKEAAPRQQPVMDTKPDDGTMSEETSGVEDILELLCVLGTAYKQLCQYHCREALQTFHVLSPEQFQTGWVLHHVGRAYFEIADYQNAKRSFELMQQVEPHRMQGLEVLSTILWHLKKEVELSHLAQRAIDFDRMSPEAWCVVGNCFSLQKENETALAFFRRSIQLNEDYTYAHTLSGHEYMANEDLDKAVACYRNAIRVDERHYNAWYGLGSIYYRQEKYDLAEYHYRRAICINPQSAVLLCHLGMAQHSNGMPYEALDTLAEAFRIDPRNPQARYQRATIYMALERPHEALEELKKVRDAAPRESSVHFAMGRVLKRIGRPEQAMRCFLTAMDLDPKDNNVIKAAMDKLDEPDVDEEVSAF